PGPPQFTTSLHSCGRVIAVSGLTVDTTLVITSQQLGVIGSTLVTSPTQEVPVSPLLVEGDVISLRVHACSGDVDGQERAQVQPRPAPGLGFSQDPYFEADTQVLVKGITPGSRVDLFVDATLVGSADVATAVHLYPIPPLKVGDLLLAQQSECGGPADQVARSTPVQAVRQLELKVDTALSDAMFQATAGLTVLVQATVTDKATQSPVAVGVNIQGVAGSIPSNSPTSITVPLQAGAVASCSIAPTPGYRCNSAPLVIAAPLKVINTQPNLVVESSSLVITFDDDSTHAQHRVPDLLQGPLLGVPRRKKPVRATLVGSVTYHLAISTLSHLTARTGSDTSFLVGPDDRKLTVWVNNPESPPSEVDFTTTK
ncbi:MAG: hypothetical protein ABJA16_11465, partial [Nakamurella sp.]